VSRRSKRRLGPHGGPGAGEPERRAEGPREEDAADEAPGSGWSLGVQVAFAIGVFAVVTLVAELAGAANLGVALGVGQVAFAIAVIYLLVRR
jgi:hypothetical protein